MFFKSICCDPMVTVTDMWHLVTCPPASEDSFGGGVYTPITNSRTGECSIVRKKEYLSRGLAASIDAKGLSNVCRRMELCLQG